MARWRTVRLAQVKAFPRAKNLPVRDVAVSFREGSSKEKMDLNFKRATVASALKVLGARSGLSTEMKNGRVSFKKPRREFSVAQNGRRAAAGYVAVPAGLSSRVGEVFGEQTSVPEALGMEGAELSQVDTNNDGTTEQALEVPPERQSDVEEAVDSLQNPTGKRTLLSSVFRVPPDGTGPTSGEVSRAQFHREFVEMSRQKGTEWEMLSPVDVSSGDNASSLTELSGIRFNADGTYKTSRGLSSRQVTARVQPDGLGNQVNFSQQENGRSISGDGGFYLQNDHVQVIEIAPKEGFRRYSVVQVLASEP